jgi:hypothetical protein
MTKLEASHPFAATINNGVVSNGEDASGLTTNYYSILQKIFEYTFGGAKEVKVVFFLSHPKLANFGMCLKFSKL